MNIVSRNTTAVLELQANSLSLLDASLALEIKTYTVEEDSWYNTTKVYVELLDPMCYIRQDHIDTTFSEAGYQSGTNNM